MLRSKSRASHPVYQVGLTVQFAFLPVRENRQTRQFVLLFGRLVHRGEKREVCSTKSAVGDRNAAERQVGLAGAQEQGIKSLFIARICDFNSRMVSS